MTDTPLSQIMICITANVSNAIVNYNMHFKKPVLIGDIPTSYQDPEQFVNDLNTCVKQNVEFRELLIGKTVKETELI